MCKTPIEHTCKEAYTCAFAPCAPSRLCQSVTAGQTAALVNDRHRLPYDSAQTIQAKALAPPNIAVQSIVQRPCQRTTIVNAPFDGTPVHAERCSLKWYLLWMAMVAAASLVACQALPWAWDWYARKRFICQHDTRGDAHGFDVVLLVQSCWEIMQQSSYALPSVLSISTRSFVRSIAALPRCKCGEQMRADKEHIFQTRPIDGYMISENAEAHSGAHALPIAGTIDESRPTACARKALLSSCNLQRQ